MGLGLGLGLRLQHLEARHVGSRGQPPRGAIVATSEACGTRVEAEVLVRVGVRVRVRVRVGLGLGGAPDPNPDERTGASHGTQARLAPDHRG